MKKITVLLLVTILSLSPFSLSAFADEALTQTFKLELIADGKLIPATTYMPSQVKTASIDNDLFDVIYQGLKNLDAEIDITSFGLEYYDQSAVNLVFDTYQAIANDCPDIFYLGDSVNLDGAYINGVATITKVIPQYIENVEEHKVIFDRKTAEILSRVIKQGMTDEEKALTLHDYIVANASYNEGTTTRDDHTAYGIIVKNFGVCQSYALAYNYLLSLVGVETKFCPSDPMVHAWSLVKLNGKWYHVDITWDDPIYSDEESNNKPLVQHGYYLLSDETITGKEHYGWTTDVTCTDKGYEAGMPYQDDASRTFTTASGSAYTGYYPRYAFKYNEADGLLYSKLQNDVAYIKTNIDGRNTTFITADEYNKAATLPNGVLSYQAINITDTATFADVNNISNSYAAFDNGTATAKTGKMIVALYNNNKLVSCQIQNVTIPANQVYAVKISPIDKNGAASGKIFLWNTANQNEIAINATEF